MKPQPIAAETYHQPTCSLQLTKPMSEYNSVADVELTNDHYNFVRNAGASEMLIQLAQFSPQQAGVTRNSIREQIRQHVFWGDISEDNDPEQFSHLGGGFFTQIWEGKLYEAYCRADLNNQAILVTIYGTDRIIEAGVRNGRSLESAERMVEQVPVVQ